VKTVNIQAGIAKSPLDKTVGCFQEQSWKVIAIDWVTCRSALDGWLNVQSGHHKSASFNRKSRLVEHL